MMLGIKLPMMMNIRPMPPQTSRLTILLLCGSMLNTVSSVSQVMPHINSTNSVIKMFHTLPNRSKFWCLGSMRRTTSIKTNIASGSTQKIRLLCLLLQPFTSPLAPQWVGTVSGRAG